MFLQVFILGCHVNHRLQPELRKKSYIIVTQRRLFEKRWEDLCLWSMQG